MSSLVPRPATPPDDFDDAWHRALDELELEVDRAELLLRDGHAETAAQLPRWTPPTMRAPLPETLRERAERLLERQLAVTGRLAAAMTSSRRHLDLVEQLVPSDPRPMYVDQAL